MERARQSDRHSPPLPCFTLRENSPHPLSSLEKRAGGTAIGHGGSLRSLLLIAFPPVCVLHRHLCSSACALSWSTNTQPDTCREAGQPHSQAQALTRASSGRGSLSSSSAVQRREVSPAARAGGRCLSRRGRRFPPRCSGAGSTTLHASGARAN